jgi:hypothetical protein
MKNFIFPIHKLLTCTIGIICFIFLQVPMVSTADSKAADVPEVLYHLIDQELERAKLSLDHNTHSSISEIEVLKMKLDILWGAIMNQGYAENIGTDFDLRPVYITMQGIIETAITKAFQNHLIKEASINIIAPRMPTPLMLKAGTTLDAINLNDPQGFAAYRNHILVKFLKAGGSLRTFYSHDAKSILSKQELSIELENYESYCNLYDNLYDIPVLKIDFEKFPQEMTGAIYELDGSRISIESRQVDQIDNQDHQLWSIKFGKYTDARMNEIDSFLKETL